MGRYQEAVAPLARAFAIAETGAREDASDADSRGQVGTTGLVLADVLRHLDSRRALRSTIEYWAALEKIPNNPRARLQEVKALAGSSYPLVRLGRCTEARQRLDSAFDRLRQLKLYPAAQIGPGSVADRVLSARADFEAAQGRTVQAIDIYEELLGKVMLSEPAPETSLTDAIQLSRVYAAMGELNRRIGREESASALEARRLELWRRWDARLSNNAFVHRQLDAAARTEL